MSRHRNIRQMRYQEEYDDFYGSSVGKSFEEDLKISPDTAEQYLYNGPGNNKSLFNFDETELNKLNEKKIDKLIPKKIFELPSDPIDKAKLLSCVHQIQDVVGETIPEFDIQLAIIKYKYNFELALNSVLTGEKIIINTPSINELDLNNSNTKNSLYDKQKAKNEKVTTQNIKKNNTNVKIYVDKPENNPSSQKNQFIKNIDITYPKLKSKTIDLKKNIEDYQKLRFNNKERINLVVIGHVDAGKSTLMGHLLLKMGYVSSKKMHSYEFNSKKVGKSSFSYAWILDQTDEERNRGVTIDIAQAYFETEHKDITLLDAPGHKDFIPNMITGASQADAAILVIDATKGEFESGFNQGGQTREHTMLIKSLGISQLAVVINKLDNVDWNEKRFTEIELQMRPFLKQVGFKLNEVKFIPCSGLAGENLNVRSKISELTSWFTGPCLIEVIDLFKSNKRNLDKNLRFYINNVYRNAGMNGIFVSGKVESGVIRTSQKLTIRPNNKLCTVKNLYSDEKLIPIAFAGDNIEICLTSCDELSLFSGVVLCEPFSLIPVSSNIEGRIIIFNNITVPITLGCDVVFHYKSLNEEACLTKLISLLDKSNGNVLRKFPRCLPKNSSGIVEIKLYRSICLELYQDYKELGRFLLRSKGVTIAAGIITKII